MPPVGATLDLTDSPTPSSSLDSIIIIFLQQGSGLTSYLPITCRVIIESLHGSKMEARALVDSESSSCLLVHLPHFSQFTRITGVAGLHLTLVIPSCPSNVRP